MKYCDVGIGHYNEKMVFKINPVGTEYYSVPTTGRNYGLLSKIVKSFKHEIAKQIHQQFGDYEFKWQRSFYDRIIRDNQALFNIRRYIINNPNMWNRDRNNKNR